MTDGGSGSLGSASGSITLEVGGAMRSLQRLENQLNSLDGAGSGLGGGLGAAMDGVAKKAESAAERINAAASRIRGVGVGLTAGVTAPLAALGFTVVGMASDVNESISAVNTVYGDAAAGIIANSEGAAEAVGLTQGAYLQAATGLSAYAQMAASTTEEQAAFSESTIAASADLASFYNTSSDQALSAIQAGLRGEGDALEQYGIILTQANVEAYALANGIGDGTTALTDQQLVLARQGLILDGLGSAEGDFARTSDGLANQQRILGAEVKDLGASFGQILLPVMAKGVDIIRGVVGAITKMSKPMQTVVVVIAAVAAAMGPLLVVLGTVLGAVGSVVGAFSAGGVLAGVTALLGPIALVVAAIVGLGIAYKTNFLGFGDAVRSVGSTVKDAFNGIVDGITGFVDRFQNAFNFLRNGSVLAPIHDLAGNVVLVSRQIAEPMQLVESVIHAVAAAIRGIGGDNTPAFLVNLAAWLDRIAPQVQGFVDTVQAAFGYLSDIFSSGNAEAGLERFDGALRPILHGVGKLVDTAHDLVDAFGKGGFLGVIRAIPDELRDVRDAFSLIFRGIGKAITNFTKDIPVVGTVVKVLGRVFSTIGETIDKVVGQFNVFRNVGMSPVSAAVAALSNTFTGFRDTFRLVGEQVENLMEVFFGLRDAITSLISGDLGGAFDGLKRAFAGVLDAIGTGARLLGTLLLDAFEAIDWGRVGSLLMTGLGLALDGLGAIGGWIGDAIGRIDFISLGTTILEGLTGAIGSGLEILSGFVADIVTGATKAWNDHKEEFLSILRNLAGDLLGVITSGAAVLGGFVLDVVTGAVNAWNDNKETFLSILRNLAGDLLGIIGDGAGVLLGLVGQVVDGAVSAWNDNKERFLVILRNLPGDLLGIIGDGAEVLASFVGDIVDGAVEHWGEVVQPFKDIFINLGSDLINLLNLDAIPIPDLSFISDPIQELSDTIAAVAGFVVDTAWPKLTGWADTIGSSLGTPDFSAFSDPIQAVSDVVSGVADYIVDTAWPKLTGWAGLIGGSLGTPDFSAFSSPIQAVSDTIAAVADFIVDTAWPKLTGWADTAVSALAALDFSTFLSPIQGFSDTVTGVVDWVVGKFGELKTFLDNFTLPEIPIPDLSWIPFIGGDDSAAPMDPANGGGGSRGFGAGTAEAPANVDAVSASAIAIAVEDAAARVRTAFQQIIGDGVFMKESLVTQFTDAGLTIGGGITAFNSDVPVRFGQGMTDIVNHAINMKLGIVQQFIDAGVTIGGHLTGFLNDVPVRFGTGMTDIMDDASTMKLGVTADFRDTADTGIGHFTRLVSDAVGKLKRGATDLRDAGRYAGEMAALGVAEGLDNYAYRVTNAVNNIVNEVDRAFRAGLKVASPSKLTDYFAEMTIEGFAGGLVKRLSRVAGAISQVMGTVRSGFESATSAATQSLGTIADLVRSIDTSTAKGSLPAARGRFYENLGGAAWLGNNKTATSLDNTLRIIADTLDQVRSDGEYSSDGLTHLPTRLISDTTQAIGKLLAPFQGQTGIFESTFAALQRLISTGSDGGLFARTPDAIEAGLTRLADQLRSQFSLSAPSAYVLPPPSVGRVGSGSTTIINQHSWGGIVIDAKNVDDFMRTVEFAESLSNGSAAGIVFGAGTGRGAR